jgi:TfoX/Sxy family transcriptional regulator of competence genes
VCLDETLLERLRRLLPRHGDVVEKQMVGGRSFSLAGRMCCGVTRGGLMVRVGRDQVASALDEPFVSRMSMGGRSLAAFVVVAPEGLVTDAALEAWVQRAVRVAAEEVSSMPTATKAPPSRSAHQPGSPS